MICSALGNIRSGGKDINPTTSRNLFFLMNSLLSTGMKCLPLHNFRNLLPWLIPPRLILPRNIKEIHPSGYKIALLSFLRRLYMWSKAKINHFRRTSSFLRIYQVKQELSLMLNPMTSTFRHYLLTGSTSFQLFHPLLTLINLIIVKNVIRLDPLDWGYFALV